MHEISRWHREVRIIAVTGNAFDEDRERAAAAGMAGHIAKPVQFEALRASLAGMRPLPREEGRALRLDSDLEDAPHREADGVLADGLLQDGHHAAPRTFLAVVVGHVVGVDEHR